MASSTRGLWEQQNRHEGDRARLFAAVAEVVPAERVLYAGSSVDLAASFVFREVVYVDTDVRAARFFADTEEVGWIVAENDGPSGASISFLHQDFTQPLPLTPASFDLLISLSAGFVSVACTDYLRVGGTLFVNPSDGDAAMASIDPRYLLSGVIHSRKSGYRVRTDGLDAYLVPKTPVELTPKLLRERGKGIPYTKSAFAYLFERIK